LKGLAERSGHSFGYILAPSEVAQPEANGRHLRAGSGVPAEAE